MSKATALSLVRLAAFAGALGLASAASHAQWVPRLVADIEPDAQLDRSAGRISMQVVELGGRAFFQTDDGIHGLELWSTDGTAAGTAMVIDLCPGRCPGRPQYLTRVGDHIYFQGDNGVFGAELWRTDGTAQGTELVADIREGLPGSRPDQLKAFGSRLFFQANDGLHGLEPWISDGLTTGTFMLADTVAGAQPPWRRLRTLEAVGSKMLFGAHDSQLGFELWATDGTPAGTALLKDIHSGLESSLLDFDLGVGADRIIGPDGRLYFGAEDAEAGFELWVSDGTSAGTQRVADILPGDQGSEPQEFAVLGSAVLFSASDDDLDRELWRTDGTAAGTSSILETPADGFSARPRHTTTAGTQVYFAGRAPTGDAALWVSDGTAAGTSLVRTFPGIFSLEAAFTGMLMHPLGDSVVFFAPEPNSGLEPWISDGTSAGTRRLADIEPGDGPSFPWSFFEVPFADDQPLLWNGRSYFRAFESERGSELWATDGTPEGTLRLLDLNQQTSSFETLHPTTGLESSPRLLRAGQRLLALARNSSHGQELWSSDGTQAGTSLLLDASEGSAGSFLRKSAEVAHEHVFTLSTFLGETLTFRSNGTAGGTVQIFPEPNGSPLVCQHLTSRSGEVFCDDSGWIWRWNGFNALLVATLDKPSFELQATATTPFAAIPGSTSDQLWSLVGGAPHQVLPAGILARQPGGFAAGESLLFFKADDGVHGVELWVSDGTTKGTGLVMDVHPTASGFPASEFEYPGSPRLLWPLVTVGDRAFFVADDGVSGRELWVSDSTEVGTHRVADLNPAGSSDPQELTACGDRLCFVAFEPGSGRELWVTDGSAAGTRRIADLVAGPGSSLPQSLSWQDGRLYFSAWTPGLGREAWSWNAAEEPALVGDVATGPSSSSPMSFRWAAGQIFFVANDGTTGFELWSAATATLFSDGFETGDLSGWSLTQP